MDWKGLSLGCFEGSRVRGFEVLRGLRGGGSEGFAHGSEGFEGSRF